MDTSFPDTSATDQQDMVKEERCPPDVTMDSAHPPEIDTTDQKHTAMEEGRQKDATTTENMQPLQWPSCSSDSTDSNGVTRTRRLAATAAMKVFGVGSEDDPMSEQPTDPLNDPVEPIIDVWTAVLDRNRAQGLYTPWTLAVLSASEVTPWLLERKFNHPFVVTDPPSMLGFHIPKDMDIDFIVEHVGGDLKVPVIWVAHQNEVSLTLNEWREYFISAKESRNVIMNVLSLEISGTPLGKLIGRPAAVRYVDLVEQYWPKTRQLIGDMPHIQMYCLMSAERSYTDFHIDFGGTSVFYHIVSGQKTFFLIKPTLSNIKLYNEWIHEEAGTRSGLASRVSPGHCYEVNAAAGQTLFIPSGWIHAVYTPVDTIVIGGNFLTCRAMEMQIRVHLLELSQHIETRFTLPNFSDIMWYTLTAFAEETADNVDVEQAKQLIHLCAFLAQHPLKCDQDSIPMEYSTKFPLPPADLPLGLPPYKILHAVASLAYPIIRALRPSVADSLADSYSDIIMVCRTYFGHNSLRDMTKRLALITEPAPDRVNWRVKKRRADLNLTYVV